MKLLYRFYHALFYRIKKIMEVSLVLIMGILASIVFMNVVLRYGFNTNATFVEELSRFLFVWLTFIGAVITFHEYSHVSVSFFIKKLSSKMQLILSLITNGMMLFCCYLIVFGSFLQARLNWNNITPILEIPTGLVQVSGIVCGIGIGMVLIARIAFTLKVLLSRLMHKEQEQ
ncbi:2,3-diketo-L-gulonate TRAP transporter small permease protein [Gammaproteobacteria bacterium]|nr:2,3-diketo-L-gulonate TRAP transporter small permease protein [Gammaproteobacteria bacterium]